MRTFSFAKREPSLREKPKLTFQPYCVGLPVGCYNRLENMIEVRVPIDRWQFSYIMGENIRLFENTKLKTKVVLSESELLFHIINHEWLHYLIERDKGHGASVDLDFWLRRHGKRMNTSEWLVLGL